MKTLKVTFANHDRLHELGDLGEFDEVVVTDLIEHVPWERILEEVGRIAKYVKIGGLLSLQFTELDMVITDYENGALDLAGLNKTLYGLPTKRSAVTGVFITTLVEQLGLQLAMVSPNKATNKYTVVAKRVQ